MDPRQVIYVQLEAEGCTAEVYVNRILVIRLVPTLMPFASIAAHQFLIPETNDIEPLVEPGNHPARTRTDLREMRFTEARAKARLIRFEEGLPTDPEYGQPLVEVSWACQPGMAETFPRSIMKQVELGAMFGRWAFQDAPPLTLDEALVDEGHAVLKAIGEAFRLGSTQQYQMLLDQQIRDALRAYPALSDQFVKDDLAQLVAYYRRSPDPVYELDRQRHAFRLVARERMIECIDDDFRPSLRLRDPDGSWVPSPFFLARISGKLCVVR